jgi:branched-subunit amino acid aminotransferase/4-amino-4-deoxychorismate lyase
MNERIVYLNGEFVPESRATVSILDRGFQGGEGVYDVGRTYGHKSFRLRRHVERLFRSLRYTRIEIDESPDRVETVAEDVLERNRALLGEWDEYAIWFNVSRGVWPWVPTAVRKGRPTVAVYCLPISFRSGQSRRIERIQRALRYPGRAVYSDEPQHHRGHHAGDRVRDRAGGGHSGPREPLHHVRLVRGR